MDTEFQDFQIVGIVQCHFTRLMSLSKKQYKYSYLKSWMVLKHSSYSQLLYTVYTYLSMYIYITYKIYIYTPLNIYIYIPTKRIYQTHISHIVWYCMINICYHITVFCLFLSFLVRVSFCTYRFGSFIAFRWMPRRTLLDWRTEPVTICHKKWLKQSVRHVALGWTNQHVYYCLFFFGTPDGKKKQVVIIFNM